MILLLPVNITQTTWRDESDGEEKITSSNYATSEEEDLSEDEVPIKKSGTVWLDHNVTSKVKLCSQQVNRQLRVDAVSTSMLFPPTGPFLATVERTFLTSTTRNTTKSSVATMARQFRWIFLIKNAVC